MSSTNSVLVTTLRAPIKNLAGRSRQTHDPEYIRRKGYRTARTRGYTELPPINRGLYIIYPIDIRRMYKSNTNVVIRADSYLCNICCNYQSNCFDDLVEHIRKCYFNE
jgi:hypothetical protein